VKRTSTFSFAGTFLLSVVLAGCVSESFANQEPTKEGEHVSPSDVVVTIVLPSGKSLSGTTVVTLEDVSLQDAPSEILARSEVASNTLQSSDGTIVVPIDLSLVSPNAIINASVHVDADTDGTLSDGDWISDSIVPVVSNSKMSATISIVEVGT